MVVLVTAAGDPLNILVAQRALLAAATLAGGRHAALGILLPGALEAFSPVQAIARILGLQVFLGILAHLWRIHRVPVILAAGVDPLRIFTAKLALLTATAAAAGLQAALHVLLPGALEAFSPVQARARSCGLGLASVDLRSHRFQSLLGAAGFDVAGIFATQLTLLAATTTAEAVHAGRHASRHSVDVFAAKLTLLSAAPAALAFNAILQGLCRSQCQHQAEHKSTSHGNAQADGISTPSNAA